MKKQLTFLLTLTILTSYSFKVVASNSAPDNITITTNDGDFDLIYHRASTSATGAVLFGIIGAAIEESGRADQDTQKKEEVLKKFPSPSCSNKLLPALKKQLSKKYTVLDQLNPSETQHLNLDINIVKCGFKVVDSTSNLMSSFIVVKSKLTDINSSKNETKFKVYITGKKRYSYQSLLENMDISIDQFHTTIAKAGKRIANKVIYKK